MYSRVMRLVLLIVGITAVSFWLSALSMRALERRDDANQVERSLLSADVEVQAFARTRQIEHAREAQRLLTQADSVLSTEGARSEPLSSAVHTYTHALSDYVQTTVARGLDETSGAEGRFRESVHAVESRIREADALRPHIYMLSARRNEKDFIVRGRPEYISRVHAALDSLQAATATSPLAPAARRDIDSLVERYRTNFDALALHLNRLGDLRDTLDHAAAAAHREIRREMSARDRQAHRFRLTAFLATLAVGLLGIGVALGFARSLARPVGRLREAADRIAQGDLGVEVEATGSVEMDRLAEALRGVAGHVEARAQAERDLAEAEAFMATVIESAAEGVAVFDLDGRCSLWNPHMEQITGVPATDALGDTMDALLARVQIEGDHETARSRLLAGETISIVGQTVSASGTAGTRHFDATGSPLRGDRGTSHGTVVLMRDTTAQHAHEQALVEAKDAAEAARAEAGRLALLERAFLANMSHEFRTPLTGIIGFADLIEVYATGEAQEFATLIGRSGERLLDTLNAVLDFAQVEAGTIEICPEAVDVAALVMATATRFRAQAKEQKLALHVEGPSSGVMALADRAALERVLKHLVSNAFKFTEAGSVTLATHTQIREGEPSVCITVQDTGIGIDAAFVDCLFDPFRQESLGHGRTHEGNGLGLAIVRGLVEAMGGTIDARSVQGYGSTFSIDLPGVEAPAPAARRVVLELA
ncbi:MAG: ATP-binding protein [Bacteroidota bacterium]